MILRETENFKVIQGIYKNIAVVNKITEEKSSYIVDVNTRDAINHIKHLNDVEFDDYCFSVLNKM